MPRAGPPAAWEVLSRELREQVLPDGAQIELTPHYHGATLSSFRAACDVAVKNGVPLPAGYGDDMRRMYEYLMYVVKPNGCIPMFNDSDRGDERGWMADGARRFGAQDMLYVATGGKQGTAPAGDLPRLPLGGAVRHAQRLDRGRPLPGPGRRALRLRPPARGQARPRSVGLRPGPGRRSRSLHLRRGQVAAVLPQHRQPLHGAGGRPRAAAERHTGRDLGQPRASGQPLVRQRRRGLRDRELRRRLRRGGERGACPKGALRARSVRARASGGAPLLHHQRPGAAASRRRPVPTR